MAASMRDTGGMASLPRKRLEEAMRRLAQGERAALGEVYSATHAKLFGIALRILGNRSDAEDAVQEVYVDLWHKAGRYEPGRASPISWLAVFARNRAIDRLRRRNTAAPAAPVEAAEALPAPEALAEEQLIDAEREARIHACLAALQDGQRRAIRSAFFEGQTYASLAERQGVPLGTMKSRVRRALAALKACLEQDT
jgi:RNA polymerase sigma factor (sigma-70 family)